MTDIVQRIAAKALIVHKGKVLILREAATYGDGTNLGRYHMPGGRVEPGESFMDALAREVREETGLKVTPQFPIHVGEWRPNIRGVQNQIFGVFMVCKADTDKVTLSTEHDKFIWIDPKERSQYDIMERDVFDRYAALLARGPELPA